MKTAAVVLMVLVLCAIIAHALIVWLGDEFKNPPK